MEGWQLLLIIVAFLSLWAMAVVGFCLLVLKVLRKARARRQNGASGGHP